MCWNYAHITSIGLHELNLSGCTSRECDYPRAQTAKTVEVIRRFVHRELLRRGFKGIRVDTILEYNDDSLAGQLHTENGGTELECEFNSLFDVVPQDHLLNLRILAIDRILCTQNGPCSEETLAVSLHRRGREGLFDRAFPRL